MKPSRGGAGMHLTYVLLSAIPDWGISCYSCRSIQNSSNLYNSQGFGTHALYVTKQHDNEQKSAHAANDYDPRNPVIDFSKYFNSESLDQEDMCVPPSGSQPLRLLTCAACFSVLWANLGARILQGKSLKRLTPDLMKVCTTCRTRVTYQTPSTQPPNLASSSRRTITF